MKTWLPQIVGPRFQNCANRLGFPDEGVRPTWTIRLRLGWNSEGGRYRGRSSSFCAIQERKGVKTVRKRRVAILSALWAAILVAVSGATYSQANAASAEKPNILFIFADDQCFETIAAFGHTDIETPNLDRLAKSGAVFTHAYNMGSWTGAVCVASRTMFNTGRFLWRAHELDQTKALQAEAAAGRLWSQMLADVGYETYMTGKWHVKIDPPQIFDHVVHVRPGMPRTVPEAYQRPIEGKPDPWRPWDRSLGGFWEGGRDWGEVLAEAATVYLRNAAGVPRPFFMYLAFNASHDPRQSPKEFVDKYPPERIKVPKNFLPEYPYMEEMAAGKKLRDERLAPWPRTEYAIKVHRGEYYALITHMDVQIGKILDALEATGKAKNTYIFFTADHGLAVGHHGLMGKQNMFEHSLRPPLIVVGPDVPAGKRIDTPVYIQDIMATSLELAGARNTDHVEFKSLMPVIRGEKKSLHDVIYGAYLDKQRAVIKDGWKLIYYPAVPKYLLFNLNDDPDEMNDLSEKPEFAAKLAELKKLLAEQEAKLGGPLAGKIAP
ncbi:MAG: choline-sulfatase [Planctomycetota bacterium]|nr:MAG: choline-sulfatase [Planctomycetota bacterium]